MKIFTLITATVLMLVGNVYAEDTDINDLFRFTNNIMASVPTPQRAPQNQYQQNNYYRHNNHNYYSNNNVVYNNNVVEGWITTDSYGNQQVVLPNDGQQRTITQDGNKVTIHNNTTGHEQVLYFNTNYNYNNGYCNNNNNVASLISTLFGR